MSRSLRLVPLLAACAVFCDSDADDAAPPQLADTAPWLAGDVGAGRGDVAEVDAADAAPWLD
jgi:hypothetical protein